MSHPFSKLLLSTEHTEFDAGAEALAFALAQRCGLPLAAVVPMVTNPEYEAVAPQLAAKAAATVATAIGELGHRAAELNVALDARPRGGEELWQVVVAEARDRQSDLLVLRRRGKRGFLANLLVGEMVTKVAGHVDCAVLMVPRAVTTMWSRRVLCAVDGSPEAARAIAVAASIAGECGMPVTVVAVAGDGVGQAQVDAALAAVRAQGLQAEGRLLDGKPHEAILAAAKADGADLIVIGRRGRSGIQRAMLGSTAQRVVGFADCPVLLVPA